MITYLQDLISQSSNKLISYADYINAVLYHPEHGYYMKDKLKIGRQGDFITTSNISDIYGRLMAKWFLAFSEKEQIFPIFCEIGAGNGRFAYAFLHEWRNITQSPIRYIIVESSPFHRKLQQDLISSEFSFEQLEDVAELEGMEGVIFSNELFDALPVHVIEKENDELFEVMVGIRDENLMEEKVPLGNPAIFSFLKEAEISLKEKQRMEIPLAMVSMLERMASTLKKGLVVTADYGYTAAEWKSSARAKGSLRGYYQHQMIYNVLLHPGDMDITTHIHIDYLIQKGEQLNLQFLTKLRQDEFLLKIGILKELENHYDPNPFSEVSKRNRAIRSLIMPSGISSYFHVIVQQKGLSLKEDEWVTE